MTTDFEEELSKSSGAAEPFLDSRKGPSTCVIVVKVIVVAVIAVAVGITDPVRTFIHFNYVTYPSVKSAS